VLCSSLGCSLAHWKDIRPWRSGFGPEGKVSAEWSILLLGGSERNSESAFYFCSTELNSGYFLFRRGFRTEYREFLLFLFHRTEFIVVFSSVEGFGTDSESFLFNGTAWTPLEIRISSSYSVFRGIIFCLKFPTLALSPPDILLESCGLFSEWLLILTQWNYQILFSAIMFGGKSSGHANFLMGAESEE